MSQQSPTPGIPTTAGTEPLTPTNTEHSGSQSRSKEIGDKTRRAMESAKERTEESLDRAKRQASDAYYRAKAEAARAYEDGMLTVKSTFQQRPLAYAFGAFAAGVLVGMLLPATRPERRAFSSTADRMRDAGNDLAERSRDSITAATRAAEAKIRGKEGEHGEGESI